MKTSAIVLCATFALAYPVLAQTAATPAIPPVPTVPAAAGQADKSPTAAAPATTPPAAAAVPATAAPTGAGAAAAVSGHAPAPAAPSPAPVAPPAAPGTAPADAPAPSASAATAAPAGTGPDLSAPSAQRDGIWYTAEGNPIYKLEGDGTLDYATYIGYSRYTANCMVCHGPDGMGSTYAPALKDSVMRMTYSDFTGIVAGGKQNVSAASQLVMPTFGNDLNVMCYLDGIYAYLLARGTETVPRGRPAKKLPKPDEFKTAENACMGG